MKFHIIFESGTKRINSTCLIKNLEHTKKNYCIQNITLSLLLIFIITVILTSCYENNNKKDPLYCPENVPVEKEQINEVIQSLKRENSRLRRDLEYSKLMAKLRSSNNTDKSILYYKNSNPTESDSVDDFVDNDSEGYLTESDSEDYDLEDEFESDKDEYDSLLVKEIDNLYVHIERYREEISSLKNLINNKEQKESQYTTQVSKIKNGVVVYDIPLEMKVGEINIGKVRIDDKISKEIFNNLSKTAKHENIEVSLVMEVILEGEKDVFTIVSKSSRRQIRKNGEPTHWKWDITPLKSGIHNLNIRIIAILKNPNFSDDNYDVLEKEVKKISIKSNLIFSLRHWIINKWVQIFGILVAGGFFSWIFNILRNRRNEKMK